MGGNVYEHKFLFVIGAYMAIFFTLWISEILNKLYDKIKCIKHLNYLGIHSLDLVIWHFLAFRLTIIIQIISMNLPIKTLTSFPIYDASGFWWILYIITGIYGSLLTKYILEHNIFSKVMKKLHMIK